MNKATKGIVGHIGADDIEREMRAISTKEKRLKAEAILSASQQQHMDDLVKGDAALRWLYDPKEIEKRKKAKAK